MGDDAAHGDDCAFELLERRRILGVACDQVDFFGQHFHGFAETGKIFCRRQHAQSVANFGEAALDARERYAGRASVPSLIDAFGQPAHFRFERFDRPPRHGFLQHYADLGQVVAQQVDRLVDRGGTIEEVFIDLTKLLLQPGQFLGLRSGQRIRLRGFRVVDVKSRRQPVERPLAIGDLDQSLVERCLRRRRQTRTLRIPEVGDRAVDSAEKLGDLAP
jgi:hypothetical protein